MKFNDFVHEYRCKRKTTSKLKIEQVLPSIRLSNVRIYLRDGPFKTDIGVVVLHPFEGTHRVLYVHECYHDPFGC